MNFTVSKALQNIEQSSYYQDGRQHSEIKRGSELDTKASPPLRRSKVNLFRMQNEIARKP